MIKGKIYTDKINAAMTKAINNGLKAACIMVEGQAVSLVPVDSGRLKGSITWKTESDHGDTVNRETEGDIKLKTPVKKNQGIVGTNVEYAPYVEYGTTPSFGTKIVNLFKGKKTRKGMKGRSYLRKALDIRKKDITKMFKVSIDGALK